MSDWPFVGEVPGNPIGKGRARGTAVGGYVRMYTPKKTADWESGAAMVLGAYWRRAPLEGCLEVEIMAMSARPKRLLRRKDPDGLMWKPSKPDSDNIEKSTWDALVKAGVIRDDCMVVLNRTWCCYAPRDRGPVGGIPSLALYMLRIRRLTWSLLGFRCSSRWESLSLSCV
mgnify:CR=1 FL=1